MSKNIEWTLTKEEEREAKRHLWINRITTWYLSGKKIKPFCQGEGLEVKEFRRWLYRLNLPRPVVEEREELKTNKYRQIEKIKFIPVKLTDIKQELKANESGIDIVLSNGYCVRIRPGFIESELIKALTVVRSLSC